MIYNIPDTEDPIRQGDIFRGIPRVDMSLQYVSIIDEMGLTKEVNWDSIADQSNEMTVIVSVRPVAGIVITQDCDAIRNAEITLCELRPLNQVYPNSNKASKTSSMVKILTQHARHNSKWFYLPQDQHIGLSVRSAVDFSICIRVPRIHLESMRNRRRARLNKVAYEHFREKLSEYFRRYLYDEWYPLNPTEFKSYFENYPDSQPFPWQREEETTK